MKNKLLTYQFIFIASVTLAQQNTYLDALKLQEIYNEDKAKNIGCFELNYVVLKKITLE